MRAQNELLRYQINLSQSSYQIEQAATTLAMHPAQAGEVGLRGPPPLGARRRTWRNWIRTRERSARGTHGVCG